jgi:flagellar basal body-associated protein FliL
MEEQFETEQNNQKGKSKTGLLVVLLLLLVGSGAANFFLWNKEKSATAMAVSKVDSIKRYSLLKDSLYKTLAEEEDKVAQLRQEIAMYQSGNDSLNQLLEEKEAKIRSLRAMVSGGGSSSKLRALKDSIARLSSDNTEFQGRVQTLLSENENYKAMLLEREGKITDLEGQKKTLTDKVSIAQQPSVGPVTVTPLYEKKGIFIPIYKAKKVEKLRITFDILGNKLTDKTIEKEYVVRIKNPDGIILSNDNKTVRNSDDVFTVKESISFNGTAQKIKIDFTQEPNFKKGKYNVELKEGEEVKHTFSFELL